MNRRGFASIAIVLTVLVILVLGVEVWHLNRSRQVLQTVPSTPTTAITTSSSLLTWQWEHSCGGLHISYSNEWQTRLLHSEAGKCSGELYSFSGGSFADATEGGVITVSFTKDSAVAMTTAQKISKDNTTFPKNAETLGVLTCNRSTDSYGLRVVQCYTKTTSSSYYVFNVQVKETKSSTYETAVNQILSTFSVNIKNTVSIKVLSPNGGEVWAIGSTHTVTWQSANAPEGAYVNVFVGGDIGVVNHVPPNGSATWTVPATYCKGELELGCGYSSVGNQNRASVVLWSSKGDQLAADASDASFSITAPAIQQNPITTYTSKEYGISFSYPTSNTYKDLSYHDHYFAVSLMGELDNYQCGQAFVSARDVGVGKLVLSTSSCVHIVFGIDTIARGEASPMFARKEGIVKALVIGGQPARLVTWPNDTGATLLINSPKPITRNGTPWQVITIYTSVEFVNNITQTLTFIE